MPIIKIISPTPQRYNLQGFGLPAQFEPGEYYNVPEFAARGMMDPSRQWARLATRDDEIPADMPQATDLPQPPVHATMTTPPDQAQPVVEPPTQSAEPLSVEPAEAEPAEAETETEAVHPASPAGRKSRR